MVTAAQLRNSLIFRGPRPVIASWDLVALLTLDDPTLLDLHQRLSLAHRRGEDLATVPVPDGVSRYQAGLLAKVIAAPPPKPRPDRTKAREPTAAQAEQKLGGLVDQAEQARAVGEQWLNRNAAQHLHRQVDVASQQCHRDLLAAAEGEADDDEGGSIGL